MPKTKVPPAPSPKNTKRVHDPRIALAVVFVAGTLVVWGLMNGVVSLLASELPQIVGGSETEPVPAALEAVPVVAKQRLLDGKVLAADETELMPLGVMIENLPVVRPQSGLAAASVVYEALAEGGATRFLAMFSGPGPNLSKIGPVRSARPYYLEWNEEYDGPYAHAGGSPDALEMISAFGVTQLNGIGNAARYFWRDRGLGAPHNLFTSSELMSRAYRDLKIDARQPAFTAWTFKDNMPLDQRPTGEPYVRIKFSGYAFEAEYRYRRETNTYARFNAGAVHADQQTGDQIQANNVLVQVIPPILDVGEKGRLTLDVTGSGKALIFVDGGINLGTWKKVDRASRTEFFLENGQPALLNRGSTWIAVVPEDRAVEYGDK